MKISWNIDQFDSRIFGYPVAKISMNNGDAECFAEVHNELLNTTMPALARLVLARPALALIITRTPLDRINIVELERYGYELMGTSISYKMEGEEPEINLPIGFSVEKKFNWTFVPGSSKEEFINNFVNISHYANNCKLSKERIYDFYSEWLYNTFGGYLDSGYPDSGYADRVFCILCDGQLAGFISFKDTSLKDKSLKLKKNRINIDLLGVLKKYRGLGIGKSLIKLAVLEAKNLNKDLFVTTQAENIPANKIYQKSGFVVDSFELVYHLQTGLLQTGLINVQNYKKTVT